MWEEDDLDSSVEPKLESIKAPVDGHYYTMYHGTSKEAAQNIKKNGFNPSSGGMLGQGVYLSRDLQKASRYPLNLHEHERAVLKVVVNVGKVKRIDRQGHPLQKTWHYNGYDTAWCPPKCGMVPSGLEEDCVWDPNRIKVCCIIEPKLWEDDDLDSSAEPKLESFKAPGDNQYYTMYHGTSKEVAQIIKKNGFKPSSDGMLGPGVYLSRDLQKASHYPLDLREHERAVLKVVVNVGKVKRVDRQGHPLQKTWHYNGYNTAWCPPKCGMVRSGLEEDCVWDPKRIKVRRIIEMSRSRMWEEDDLDSSVEPKLESIKAPVDGHYYTMYHGTSKEAAQNIKKNGFNPSSGGMLGQGVYLSRDLQKASRYPLNLHEHERAVLKVVVNVGKVKRIDRQGHPLQKTWHYNGYDTAWCPPKCGMVPSGLEEDCVWDPNRIKVCCIIEPKLWEDDDLDSSAEPKLESFKAPGDNQYYTMYHGTSKEVAQIIKKNGFKPSSDGMLGPGVYLSRDLQKASHYPLDLREHERAVLKVVVNVGKVKRVDRQGHPLQKTWHYNGYNTAWCPPKCGMVRSGLEEDCVWDPKRIKVLEVSAVPEDDFSEDHLPRLESSATPADGGVYTMYHGTSRAAAAGILKTGFRPSSGGMLGPGVYVSRDLQKAIKYPLGLSDHERVVLKVRVEVGKVIAINYQGHPMQKTWRTHGYDTAWCPPNCGMVRSGQEEDCVWDAKRVKVLGILSLKSPKLWAEEDFDTSAEPKLESYKQPGDGRYYTMYHGTSKENADSILKTGFKPSSDGMLGQGVYLSRDLRKASRYPLNKPVGECAVLKVTVNVGKVKRIDCQNHPMQKTWHKEGYDTAWCPPDCGMVPSGLEEDCVWDPKKIKVRRVIQPQLDLVKMWAENDFPPPGQPRLDSLVAPLDNKVYTMYHGTSRKAADSILKTNSFKQSSGGMLGPGVYLSRDLQKASRYPLDLPEHERVVLRVKVAVGRVIAINYQGHPMQMTWHAHGYDTAWCPPNCGMVKSGLEEDCVWDPNRIEIVNVIRPQVEDDFPEDHLPRLESSATPADGGAYTMYHGTSRAAAAGILKTGFRPSSGGMLGPGVYVSRDLQKAIKYPLGLSDHDRIILKVKVEVGKVIAINYQGHPLQKTWRAKGYDTAWCPPNCGMVPSNQEEDCVWDAKRVKVLGVFSPKSRPTGNRLWEENDFDTSAVPKLESYKQPLDNNYYTMYHGTSRQYADSIKANGFEVSFDGMLGQGVYLSRDLQKASRYPPNLPLDERVVLKVTLNVGKVIKIDCLGHPMRKTWRSNGYDTAWCPPECMVRSSLEEDCVSDPSRIKVHHIIPPNLDFLLV
ncbi:uncharacterized protein LOC134099153 [Sardina pilchardus]|uniref:uncharacterized protein LOC134099153 n=1 Tax=Sardina pilchardus TaxID=27697 RepID=UPI002E12D6BE